MSTGLPSVLDILPIRSGLGPSLVQLARNRRVDVAWVLGVHARSVGPFCVFKVILSESLVSRAVNFFVLRNFSKRKPWLHFFTFRFKGVLNGC